MAPSLTVLQVEHLQALADGETPYQIAERRGRSRITVHKVIRNARRELGAKNACHAVALAFRLGLIQ